ncbi:PA14 domain-containing protein [Archaeoglobus sp.]
MVERMGISSVVGLMLLVFVVVAVSFVIVTHSVVLNNIVRYLSQSTPNVILDVRAEYYTNMKELSLSITHKGGDSLDLRNVEIILQTNNGSKKLQIFNLGSGFESLKAYYYRLNTTATDPLSLNPDDIVFGDLVLSQDENSIDYHWGLGGPAGLSDYFGAEWIGKLYVPESGNYTFYLTSDDGSWLWIDGKLVINNGGLHGDTTKSSKIYLNAGTHLIKVKMFEWTGYATCVLTWSYDGQIQQKVITKVAQTAKTVLTALDSVNIHLSNVTISTPSIYLKIIYIPTHSILFEKEIFVQKEVKPMLKGLVAYYYTDENWGKLAKVRVEDRIWYADDQSGWSSDIPNWPYPIIGKTDVFSVKWVGYLYVPSTGYYTFYLTSDDGSWLYIDNELIIDNGGLHGPIEKSATVYLTEGYHKIEVDYFENYGGAVIHLEWEKVVNQQPTKSFLYANWTAYYYTDENWQNLGYIAHYYNGRIRFADLNSGYPSDVYNWPVPYIGKSDQFSVIFTANVYLPEDDYTFYLTSDDGSWLYIDGNLVIDNGGLHPPQEEYSGIHLNAGIHHFEVKMFEHYGGAVVYLEYAKGVAIVRTPVDQFYHTQ